jgi:hypothetical protein
MNVADWAKSTGSLFDPTANESDSGIVQDHMAELDWMVTMYTGPHPDYDEPVKRCCIMRGPQDGILGTMVDVIADTRPLAICGAFVEAMERWGEK